MIKDRPDINLRIVESSVNICRFALNDTYQDKNGYAYMHSRGVKLYGNTGKNNYLASLQSHFIQEDIFNNAPTQLNAKKLSGSSKEVSWKLQRNEMCLRWYIDSTPISLSKV